MKIEDFQLEPRQALRLQETDALVSEGLSRERSSAIVSKLIDIIDGPWEDLLNMMDNSEGDATKTLIQTFWISYVYKWSSEKLKTAGRLQAAMLAHFAKIDSGTRED